MNAGSSTPPGDSDQQIAALIATLHETGQRLEELTAGEVDAVANLEGRTFVLQRAQEQLRHIEAVKQATILNALPAHIALLDIQGVIVSVNDAWRRFAGFNALQSPGEGVGLDYLATCDAAQGDDRDEAHQAAAGIRAVLAGREKTFSLEYPCHSPAEQRWFLLTVTPLAGGRPNGVVVMHLDVTARRKAEEVVRANEVRFQALIEHLSDVIVLTRLDGVITYVSPSMKEMGGYEPAELVGRNLFEFMHADDIVRGMAVRAEMTSSPGVPVHAELRFRHQDGSWQTLEAICRNLVDLPSIGGVVVNVRNVTQRKRAEAAVIESKSRYHSLFENMLEGYAYCEAVFEGGRLLDFTYLEVNGAFERLTGLKDVIGKKVSEILPGIREANPDLFEIYGRVTLTGKAEKFETYLVALKLWMSVTVYSQDKKHFVAVFDNVTERKRTEEALRTSEKEFRALAEAMPQMVWITRADGWNIYFSQQWMNYTGLTLEESLGHGWTKPFHPEDQQRAWDAWQNAVTTIGIYSIECRLRRADGAYLWWLIRGVPQQDADGNILKWFGTCTDIHELKLAGMEISRANQSLRESEEKATQAYAELEQAHKQLLAASRLAGMAEVAASVLHNVGNVLNSVNVSASLVMDNVKNSRAANMAKVAALLLKNQADLGSYITHDPKGRHVPAVLQQLSLDWLTEQQTLIKEMDSLRSNIDHIKSIVAMQQGYARIAGSSETVNLNELVEDSLRMESSALLRGQVQVIRDFETVPPIITDKHKILQILVNLVRNAKQACDEYNGASKVITLRTTQSDGRIRISVSDNGIGIAPENLTRIFSHGFTTRKDGHGFGLHSGALAAAELGGSLSVHSDGPGQGATFTLALPFAPQALVA